MRVQAVGALAALPPLTTAPHPHACAGGGCACKRWERSQRSHRWYARPLLEIIADQGDDLPLINNAAMEFQKVLLTIEPGQNLFAL